MNKLDSKSRNWMNDAAMNLLVDYYPEVPFRPYGSGATRQNVLPWLRELELGYICIYAKGHGGYTTWPSSLRTAHPMLAQDMPKLFRELTRETGTKLVLYYSGMIDGIAGLRHPEWRMRLLDGSDYRVFHGLNYQWPDYSNCPHSAYFDDWIAVQLRELIEGYAPDGIWVDGDWTGPCYCDRCQTIFRNDTGWSEPWSDVLRRPNFKLEYARFWDRATHRWRMQFNDCIKLLKPDCAYSAGGVSPRREYLTPFDWRSGDFFSPNFALHDMSKMMRWYSTLGVPYDAYVCDTSFTHVRKNVRSRSKTLDRMIQEATMIAATGGIVGYWTFPLGNGALVPSRLAKARIVRQFLREREKIFLHTESLPWTAILVTQRSAERSWGPAHKALAALHRSPVLTDESMITDDLPYDLIVVGDQDELDDMTARTLIRFVERGGKLLTNGSSLTASPVLQKALGVTRVVRGALRDGHVILKNHVEPTGVDSVWDQLEYQGAEELYPLYLSWDQFNPECRLLDNNWPMHGQLDEEHPEPAGFAAALTRVIGKGRFVHLCTDVFVQYLALGDPQILRWLGEVLDHLQPAPLFKTDAPSWVDVSLRRKGQDLLIHFVNMSSGRDLSKVNTNDLWVDEIPAIGPITCSLRMPDQPAAVTVEPGGKPVEWQWKNKAIQVVLPRLHIHACLRVTPAEPAREKKNPAQIGARR